MRTVLAGDLGGTKCRFALIDEHFGVHGEQRFATIRDRQPFLQDLERAVGDALAALPAGATAPTAAGIGTAGVIPPDGLGIHHAPNLPLDQFPLAPYIRERFGLPTTLLNDGRASAWGEYLKGHAAGSDPLLCLFFGTGIGIGLMVGGKPYGGAANAAGEIGHTIWQPGGRRCPCGGLGHFEAYCGGRAITELAEERLGPGPGGKAWTVGAVAAHDSATARAILAEAATAAAALVANACTLLNPRAVVLGGGVLDGWPALREHLAAFTRVETSEPIRRDLRFVPSLGGSDAILWGAAAATRQLWQLWQR
ncbi:MAG: ROK family protein [Planctomycetes bacterium]|nr:ROK family protein [Planctomycetota bacterium]